MNIITNSKISVIEYPTGHYISQSLPSIELLASHIENLKGNKSILYIYCTGSSGSIISGIISSLLIDTYKTIRIEYIKKNNEMSHSPHDGTKMFNYDSKEDIHHVVVDDFINTGATIKRIFNKIPKNIESVDLIQSGHLSLNCINKHIKRIGTLVCTNWYLNNIYTQETLDKYTLCEQYSDVCKHIDSNTYYVDSNIVNIINENTFSEI